MLTRLRIKGFKNLREVDIRFGLFTCIAGANGVGKSNLFDAIMLLSDLSSMPVIKAFSKARGTNARTAEFPALFWRERDGSSSPIEFVAEMIVPREVVDDFDRKATPTATFLEYTLVLSLRGTNGTGVASDPIRIEREELRAKSSSAADKILEFPGGAELAKSKRFIFGPGSRTTPFIQTEGNGEEAVIRLYGEKGLDGRKNPGGRPLEVRASKTPQTVLSGVNLTSHPTALAVRREMQSWRLLQLEPTALRAPDQFSDESRLSETGQHLPNALFRLGNFGDVANQLSDLIPGVQTLEVHQDETRQQRTLSVTMSDRQKYSASSLSDGTLRFLALAVLANDPEATGIVCMEEPENGIHPLRIPEMLRLVRGLSDADLNMREFDEREGLRQVIINTHSPLVVAELPDDELLMAETVRFHGASFVNFKPFSGTWRSSSVASADVGTISRGELHAYLTGQSSSRTRGGRKLVRDHLPSPTSLDLFQATNRTE